MLDEKTKAELAELKDGLKKIEIWVDSDEFEKIEKKVIGEFVDFKTAIFKRELALEVRKDS